MKNALLITLAAAAATLAGVVAFRLSVDALAMIVGVGIGLLALIPTLALSVFMLRRSQQTQTPPAAYSQPPVIIVQPALPSVSSAPSLPTLTDDRQSWPALPAPPVSLPVSRQWHYRVIGGAEDGDDADALSSTISGSPPISGSPSSWRM